MGKRGKIPKARKDIADVIKGLREEYNQDKTYPTLKITQQQLANFLGVCLAEYMSIESGRKPISVVHLRKLANLYDVPVTYFIDVKEREKTQVKPYRLCGLKNPDTLDTIGGRND